MRHAISTQGMAYKAQIFLRKLPPSRCEVAARLPPITESRDNAGDVRVSQHVVQRDGREVLSRAAKTLLKLLQLGFERGDCIGAEGLGIGTMIARLELRRLARIVFVQQPCLCQRAECDEAEVV